jgi:hypothetical protein
VTKIAPLLDCDGVDRRLPAPVELMPGEEVGPCRLDLDEVDGESMNDEGRHTRLDLVAIDG